MHRQHPCTLPTMRTCECATDLLEYGLFQHAIQRDQASRGSAEQIKLEQIKLQLWPCCRFSVSFALAGSPVSRAAALTAEAASDSVAQLSATTRRPESTACRPARLASHWGRGGTSELEGSVAHQHIVKCTVQRARWNPGPCLLVVHLMAFLKDFPENSGLSRLSCLRTVLKKLNVIGCCIQGRPMACDFMRAPPRGRARRLLVTAGILLSARLLVW